MKQIRPSSKNIKNQIQKAIWLWRGCLEHCQTFQVFLLLFFIIQVSSCTVGQGFFFLAGKLFPSCRFFPFLFSKLGKVALRLMEEPARTQTDTLTSCFVSFLPNRMDEDSRRFGAEGSAVQSFDSLTQQLTRAERAGSNFSSNLLLYPWI